MEANLLSFDSVKMQRYRVFKHTILVLALLLEVSVGVGQVSDNFADGDFSVDPIWQGNDANFMVNPDGQLQLDATEAGQSYLSTSFSEISLDDKEWMFWIKQSFSGSDNNHGRVYLANTSADLSYAVGNGAPGTGYFLLFGEGGSDDAITLYRNDGIDASPTEICSGTPGLIAGSFELRVLVRRDDVGNWEIYVDPTGGIAFTLDSSGIDNSYPASSTCGVACNYTVSNATKFYYDDIYFGDWQVDEEAPSVISATPVSNNTLVLNVNETVTTATAEDLTNYTVSGIGNPESVEIDNNSFTLNFSQNFGDGELMTLTVSNLEDLVGNVMSPQDLDFTWTIVHFPQPGDLIINEIMPDPDTSLPSPNAEYVELYNLTDNTLDITGVQINGASFTSPTTISPNSYLTVTDEDDLISFLAFQGTIGMDGFPGLTNSGLELILTNENDVELDRVEYSDNWYKNSNKDDGGWSLELINPLDPCSDASNWRASEDFSGATVGEENSVLDNTPDTTPPVVGLAINPGSNQLVVEFNEPLDPMNTAGDAEFLSIDGNTNEIVLIDRSGTNEYWLELGFSNEGTGVYQLLISDVSDCWGNTVDVEICTGFSLEAQENEVVINEVLFDPETGGSDYVELLNISDRVTGLEKWRVASLSAGQISTEVIFTESNYTICPGEYIVLTDNPLAQRDQYPNVRMDRILTVDNLPGFPNEDAGVMLFDSLEVMDWMYYDQNQHFGLIDDTDGVSLERLNPFWPTEESNLKQNWHSAAASDNFGTPGYLNSQYLVGEDLGEALSVDPKIFSPDQDGYEDVCNISYEFNEPGRLANVTIYNQGGLPIRQLAHNELLGTSGSIKWDGLEDDLRLAPVGTYVIYFETFNLTGDVEAAKLVVVVARKF